jgi:hypothetical protein
MSEGPWADDFSYTYYRRLLNAVREYWTPHLFRDAPHALEGMAPALFLRHDVDVSLERAVRMARVEHEQGVPTKYMVMNRAVLYSIASPINYLILIGHISINDLLTNLVNGRR